MVRAGAFQQSIASGKDILALADHDRARCLLRTKSWHPAACPEDERGLPVEYRPCRETTVGNDLLKLAERGDLGGMSFAFSVAEGGEVWTGDRRELRNVVLHEISVISSWPAYDGTSVSARSRQERSSADRRIVLLDLEAAR